MDWTDAESAAMQAAMLQAALAAALGEVPVGAVLLDADGQVLAADHNRPITTNDPTAHAEIRVLRAAAAEVGNYRLPGTRLFVTLEPCPMCVGAMVHARVAEVVFAANDPRTGACGSALDLPADPSHNHRLKVRGGLMADESGALLRDFFRERRARRGVGATSMRPASTPFG